jgi:hypothetical protein
MALSQQTADELRAIINANIQPALPPGIHAAPQDFCAVWPTAKPVLQILVSLAPLMPGVGTAAAAALTALIATGQAYYDRVCGPTAPARAI